MSGWTGATAWSGTLAYSDQGDQAANDGWFGGEDVTLTDITAPSSHWSVVLPETIWVTGMLAAAWAGTNPSVDSTTGTAPDNGWDGTAAFDTWSGTQPSL